MTHVDVFTAGTEGYHSFRIPATTTAPDGSLLVMCEARKHNRADPGQQGNDIDLVSKRSTDDGRTWTKLVVLDDPGEKWSACNPALVVDRNNERVWLLYCRMRPDRSSVTARPGTDDSQAWARYSDDNGVSWSDAVDLTSASRDVEKWGGAFFGPGGAIQDRDGRLIAAIAKMTGQEADDGKRTTGLWNSYVVYSEDHGQTWQRGELVPSGDWGDEPHLIELADGNLLMDIRQNTSETAHRWFATSGDSGKTWSAPHPGTTVSPVCCAIARYTLVADGDDRNRILWTGPKGPNRQKLVVRVSYDEGKTFTVEKLLTEGPAAYSDITILDDKTVGVIWERDQYKHVTFTRFNRAFLEP